MCLARFNNYYVIGLAEKSNVPRNAKDDCGTDLLVRQWRLGRFPTGKTQAKASD